MNPAITVIVSTYNNPNALEAILHRLAKATQKPHQIIIADDGSNKRTAKRINQLPNVKNLNIRHNWQEDRGFRKCRILNKSIIGSNSEYVVFLDGDCLPHKDFVRDHMAMAEKGYFVQGRR